MFISIQVLIRQLMDLYKCVHSNYNYYNSTKKKLYSLPDLYDCPIPFIIIIIWQKNFILLSDLYDCPIPFIIITSSAHPTDSLTLFCKKIEGDYD
jgi:hypothetical protein